MVFSYVFVNLEVEMPFNLWNNTGLKCLILVFNSKPNDNHLFASSFGILLDHKIPKCGWKTVAVYLSVIFPDTDGLATTSLVWPVDLLIGKISLSPMAWAAVPKDDSLARIYIFSPSTKQWLQGSSDLLQVTALTWSINAKVGAKMNASNSPIDYKSEWLNLFITSNSVTGNRLDETQ